VRLYAAPHLPAGQQAAIHRRLKQRTNPFDSSFVFCLSVLAPTHHVHIIICRIITASPHPRA
jgi:hypothetical protein